MATVEFSQPLAALAEANRVRGDGAAVKREVRQGLVTLAGALEDPRAGVLTIADLLAAQRGWGATRADALLVRVGMGVRRRMRVRDLTARQRRVIAQEAPLNPSVSRERRRMLDELHAALVEHGEDGVPCRALADERGMDSLAMAGLLGSLRSQGRAVAFGGSHNVRWRAL